MSPLEDRIEKILRFQGPIAAVPTLYTKDGELNLEHLESFADYLFEIGVKGVFILGTTGESFTLELNEKIRLIETWHHILLRLKSNQKSMLAIVNISTMSTRESIILARLLTKLNSFDCIALMSPIIYKPTKESDLIRYFQKIIAKTDGNHPFLYYHFPDFVGPYKFDLESLLPEALKEIPQFCAIKFTDSNLLRMNFIQKNFGKQLKVFTGYDEMLLAAKTSLNIDAAICATFNLEENCRSYLQMLDLIDRNSLLEARECQNKISKVCERLREGENFFQNLKTYLQRNLHSRGIQVGNVRSPISID
ncbi:hypothetical protein NH340_JMT03493 [Sarcoptes scabiei]|nr:hypothetical protein NH340_JMT03493 [Sarcoptes scabiei]